MKPGLIEEMLEHCQQLIDMIDRVGACPELTVIHETFVESVNRAMKAYEEGKIAVDLRALPPVMYSFATEELPVLCQGGPDDIQNARRQLKLFMVSVKEILKPKYNK